MTSRYSPIDSVSAIQGSKGRPVMEETENSHRASEEATRP